MPRLTPEGQLAENTQKTYASRVDQLDVGSVESIVASVEAICSEGTPLGTALPTRAAALRLLVANFGLTESEANDRLPSVKGLKNGRVRSWLQPEKLVLYYGAVEKLKDGPVKVALLLLPQTGLRPSEMLGLKRDHVRETARGYLLEVHGKSKTARVVPVLRKGATVLRAHLAKSTSEWLFPGKDGPMSDQVLRAAISGYRNRGKDYDGIAKAIDEPDLTPYVLRHTYATGLLEAGVGIESIATLLGHEDVETTRVYAHLQPSALEAAAEKVAQV